MDSLADTDAAGEGDHSPLSYPSSPPRSVRATRSATYNRARGDAAPTAFPAEDFGHVPSTLRGFGYDTTVDREHLPAASGIGGSPSSSRRFLPSPAGSGGGVTGGALSSGFFDASPLQLRLPAKPGSSSSTAGNLSGGALLASALSPVPSQQLPDSSTEAVDPLSPLSTAAHQQSRIGRRPAASARIPTTHLRLGQQLEGALALRPPTRQKNPFPSYRSARDIILHDLNLNINLAAGVAASAAGAVVVASGAGVLAEGGDEEGKEGDDDGSDDRDEPSYGGSAQKRAAKRVSGERYVEDDTDDADEAPEEDEAVRRLLRSAASPEAVEEILARLAADASTGRRAAYYARELHLARQRRRQLEQHSNAFGAASSPAVAAPIPSTRFPVVPALRFVNTAGTAESNSSGLSTASSLLIDEAERHAGAGTGLVASGRHHQAQGAGARQESAGSAATLEESASTGFSFQEGRRPQETAGTVGLSSAGGLSCGDIDDDDDDERPSHGTKARLGRGAAGAAVPAGALPLSAGPGSNAGAFEGAGGSPGGDGEGQGEDDGFSAIPVSHEVPIVVSGLAMLGGDGESKEAGDSDDDAEIVGDDANDSDEADEAAIPLERPSSTAASAPSTALTGTVFSSPQRSPDGDSRPAIEAGAFHGMGMGGGLAGFAAFDGAESPVPLTLITGSTSPLPSRAGLMSRQTTRPETAPHSLPSSRGLPLSIAEWPRAVVQVLDGRLRPYTGRVRVGTGLGGGGTSDATATSSSGLPSPPGTADTAKNSEGPEMPFAYSVYPPPSGPNLSPESEGSSPFSGPPSPPAVPPPKRPTTATPGQQGLGGGGRPRSGAVAAAVGSSSARANVAAVAASARAIVAGASSNASTASPAPLSARRDVVSGKNVAALPAAASGSRMSASMTGRSPRLAQPFSTSKPQLAHSHGARQPSNDVDVGGLASALASAWADDAGFQSPPKQPQYPARDGGASGGNTKSPAAAFAGSGGKGSHSNLSPTHNSQGQHKELSASGGKTYLSPVSGSGSSRHAQQHSLHLHGKQQSQNSGLGFGSPANAGLGSSTGRSMHSISPEAAVSASSPEEAKHHADRLGKIRNLLDAHLVGTREERAYAESGALAASPALSHFSPSESRSKSGRHGKSLSGADGHQALSSQFSSPSFVLGSPVAALSSSGSFSVKKHSDSKHDVGFRHSAVRESKLADDQQAMPVPPPPHAVAADFLGGVPFLAGPRGASSSSNGGGLFGLDEDEELGIEQDSGLEDSQLDDEFLKLFANGRKLVSARLPSGRNVGGSFSAMGPGMGRRAPLDGGEDGNGGAGARSASYNRGAAAIQNRHLFIQAALKGAK